MSTILLYLIGPVAGLIIFAIGILIGVATGSSIDFVSILKITLGVALMTEFAVALSLLERRDERE